MAILGLAVLMLLFGAGMTYIMLDPILHGQGGRVSAWPIVVGLGGVILPFAARGRRTLRIVYDDGKYQWSPPVVVDSASRQYIGGLLDHVAGGLRAAGISVEVDDPEP